MWPQYVRSSISQALVELFDWQVDEETGDHHWVESARWVKYEEDTEGDVLADVNVKPRLLN